MIIDVSRWKNVILGYSGEHDSRKYEFDCTSLAQEFGEGIGAVVFQPPCAAAPYPCFVTQEGNIVTWIPNETDMKESGVGHIQIMWFVDSSLAKTQRMNAIIDRSIEFGEVPERYEDLLNELVELYAKVNFDLNKAEDLTSQNQVMADKLKDELETEVPAALREFDTAKTDILLAMNKRKDEIMAILTSERPLRIGSDGNLYLSKE